MGDVYEMWIRARSGISARNYNPGDCEVSITDDIATFSISFEVYPSDMDLNYNLIASFGELDPLREVVSERENFSIFFNKTDHVELEKIHEDVTFSWQTPFYLSNSTPIPTPLFTVNNTYISTEEAIFAVGMGNGIKKGYKHKVNFTIPLVDDDGNNLQIDSIDSTITASWNDGDDVETEQLKLEIPECILNSLTLCEGKPNLVCHKCEGTKMLVYFSTCEEDTVIKADLVNLYERGENKWCLADE